MLSDSKHEQSYARTPTLKSSSIDEIVALSPLILLLNCCRASLWFDVPNVAWKVVLYGWHCLLNPLEEPPILRLDLPLSLPPLLYKLPICVRPPDRTPSEGLALVLEVLQGEG